MKFKDLAGFDWNKANKRKNLIKHQVYYKECEEIFYNKPLDFFQDEKHSIKEKRYGAFGQTNKKRRLTIIFTVRNKKIRVVKFKRKVRYRRVAGHRQHFTKVKVKEAE